MRRELMPRGFRRLLMLSAVGHLVVFVGIFTVGSFTTEAAASPPQNFISTKLVKLGKKRDEKLMPRIPTQPPLPSKKVTALPSPKTKKPAVTKAKKPEPSVTGSAKDRIKDMKRVSKALDRLKRVADDAENEGDPSGVQEGTETDISKAIMGNKVATEIYRCLKSNWSIEGLPPNRVAGLKATVVIRIANDGRFVESRIAKGSKNARFDAAVHRAVNRCEKVSAPPKTMRSILLNEGIAVVFTP